MNQVNAFMTSVLGPSWRTTVIGFVAAVLNLMANGLTWKTALASVLMQAFGIMAKDAKAHSTTWEVQQATNAVLSAGKGVAES
jgi:hypothetical protein